MAARVLVDPRSNASMYDVRIREPSLNVTNKSGSVRIGSIHAILVRRGLIPATLDTIRKYKLIYASPQLLPQLMPLHAASAYQNFATERG